MVELLATGGGEHHDVELRLDAIAARAALASVQQGLSHLRGVRSVRQMLDRATVELCDACGFDRAALFRVDDARMVCTSVHFTHDPAWAAEVLALAETERPKLDHMLLETEMIRRLTPVLVLDPAGDPRTHKPLIEAFGTRSYVAAPILPEGRVIGFLHADRYHSQRDVDELDRDMLWAFAEGFGYALDRTIKLERMREQQLRLRSSMAETAAALEALTETESDLGHIDREVFMALHTAATMVVPRTAMAARFHDLVTAREREVLGLMAGGLTNTQIATRLIIAEATVKTHVKSILRKLGAANRAEAVARYLG